MHAGIPVVALRRMTEQPQPAPTPDERPLWKLDRGEWRTLIITFAGGFGSIVAAACVIGLAIALARWENKSGLGYVAAGTAVGIGTFLVVLVAARRGWIDLSKTLVIAIGVVMIGLWLLVWIGVAAGVH